ncbi:MAG: hydroxyacid dehydrogenase [Pseudomonadota bacterium]|nr:hydroxyacid dehydrogenase [Pseudomonadota bacterium]
MDILLLERLVPEALAWLQERHPVQIRVELAGDLSAIRKAVYKSAAVVLPRKVAVTRELLDFAPLLKVVARMQAGNDNTDLEACRERKIRVVQATTANVRANSEFLLASLLLLYRRGIGATLAGNGHSEIKLGRELNGSVVGIFGLAPTAHTLALSLHALGAKVVGYDPAIHTTAPIWARLHIQPVTLQEMLAQSDAISVQVMFASRYLGFINDKMLANCKRGQVWVGISRSHLFDPAALARALTDGRIEAAMLDGGQSNFATKGSPLHQIPNLFLTPRLGSFTLETRVRASWYVAHRVHEALTTPHSGPEPASSGSMELDAPVSAHGPVSALGPISGPASLEDR